MGLSINKFLSKLGATALMVGVLVFAVTACSSDGGQVTPASEEASEQESVVPSINVVATTNIVADWVENVGGDNVSVFSLVPVGVDPHTFQPGARDIARVADADLVFSVGLGLEESWLSDLLRNAAPNPSTIVELGEVIDPIEFGASDADEVALLEGISHVVHEVEGGEISPEVGLQEIEALLEVANGHEDGEHHEEDEHHEHEDGEHHEEDEHHEHEDGEHHEEDEHHEHEDGEHHEEDEHHEHEDGEHHEEDEHHEHEDGEHHEEDEHHEHEDGEHHERRR